MKEWELWAWHGSSYVWHNIKTGEAIHTLKSLLFPEEHLNWMDPSFSLYVGFFHYGWTFKGMVSNLGDLE